jgi:hypothetical protein
MSRSAPRQAITELRLNRATLDRQLLSERQPLAAVEGIRRVAALQAQEAASPYLALWNRLAGFDPAELDTAFAERAVVKASLMRITLHAVVAEDYPAFHAAMVGSLRASRVFDARYTSTGLVGADADAFLPELLGLLAVPRTRVEIEGLVKERFGDGKERLWWALKTFAPLFHAPTGGPWSFRLPAAFTAADGVDPDAVVEPAQVGQALVEQATQQLALRYLQAFGPASVKDFAQFTMLRQPVARQAMQGLGDRVVELAGPNGTPLFDVVDGSLPAEDTPAPPRLLGMWDSVLLAYADRSRILPEAYRAAVIRRNGDVLPTLLVDGHVAGVWRPVEGGIEATAFHKVAKTAWSGLADEAAALIAFLADRDPTVYRRYAHWWDKGVPGVETRILPG